ncbi:multidrug effflux MFS transporter [uncultured Amphritea sp.]|uniref:multidrug effflux MFS transporter n=1 Tax=uncultured Amphritea sp. TaxID=981605 RepID=UPI002615E93E|nr:multidrug effflux MFS transporter [uncultured Amphritea sp.]
MLKLRASQGKAITFTEFVALVAMMISLTAMSIDMMLPALGLIGRDLQVLNPNDNQLIVSVFFIGMASGQLFYGPLSDSIGRKPAILFGLLIFAIGAILSIVAESFDQMLLGRLLQGLGLAGPRVVAVALVRDLYSGKAMARVMSFVMTVFILVPMLAPALGQMVLSFSGWRWIFITLLAVGLMLSCWVVLRLEETLTEENKRSLKLSKLWQGFKEVISHPIAMGFTVITGLVQGAFLVYLNLSQPMLQNLYGLGEMFPIYYGALAGSIGLASLLNVRLIGLMGTWKLVVAALLSIFILSLVYLPVAVFYAGQPALWSLIGYLFLVFFAVGVLFGNLSALSMEPLGHLAGIGAGMVSSLAMLLGVFSSLSIGHLYNQTVYPLVVGFLVLISLGLLVCLWLSKRVAAKS